ncbi:37S ribosomal protein SWS2, mitochondrial [Termitomyces sp. J132]|nr:37S ribosomal protein SWS2, mitochondrial [Termitomyces sp. J132]
MVHILGVNLRESHVARVCTQSSFSIPMLIINQYALTSFYGIGHHTAHRLCARLQIHDKCKMKDLSPYQVTALASFLSSPSTSVTPPRYPLASSSDPLKDLKIESELRRMIRENIGHQRMIGSYVGKRHAMHLPVRGQNTQSNAKTAKKLNQLDRY